MSYNAFMIWIRSKEEILLPHQFTIPAKVDNTLVTVQMGDISIDIQFNWEDLGYSVSFVNITDNLYEGTIINQHAECGKARLQLYQYKNRYLCRIEWDETSNPANFFLIIEPKS